MTNTQNNADMPDHEMIDLRIELDSITEDYAEKYCFPAMRYFAKKYFDERRSDKGPSDFKRVLVDIENGKFFVFDAPIIEEALRIASRNELSQGAVMTSASPSLVAEGHRNIPADQCLRIIKAIGIESPVVLTNEISKWIPIWEAALNHLKTVAAPLPGDDLAGNNEWLPINTVPKSGLVDIWCDERRYIDCYWVNITGEHRAIIDGRLMHLKRATHWMPSPGAPVKTLREEN